MSGRYHKLTINGVFQNSHAKKKKKKASLAFSAFEVPDFTWLTGLLSESCLVWGIKILSNRLNLLLSVLKKKPMDNSQASRIDRRILHHFH